jgi:hypothetical protein
MYSFTVFRSSPWRPAMGMSDPSLRARFFRVDAQTGTRRALCVTSSSAAMRLSAGSGSQRATKLAAALSRELHGEMRRVRAFTTSQRAELAGFVHAADATDKQKEQMTWA